MVKRLDPFDEGASHDDLVGAIYAGVSRDAALHEALARLAARFGCASAVLIYKDRHCPLADVDVAVGPFADPAVQSRYFREFAAIDPAPAAMARIRLGGVASTDLLFAGRLDRYRAFLDGFYYPLGLGGALGGPLTERDGRVGIVAIHRGLDRAPFDEGDAEALGRLMPHLARMLDLRRQFFALEVRAEGAEAALGAATQAVMLLDARRGILSANVAARDLVAREDGLRVDRSGRLAALDREADAALAAHFARREGSTVVRAPRPEGAPYAVRLCWQPASERRRRATVAYLSDPARRLDVLPAAIGDALGLTGAGSRLVAAILAGDSLRAYADRTGVSLNTVKFHLRTVFSETGTRRQAELIRLVGTVVADLGLGAEPPPPALLTRPARPGRPAPLETS